VRVIGGEFRSRKLQSVPGRAVRPTPDRLRETLFDILGAEVVGKIFVDAYAGSGAVGIEALSRGAARAVFLEKDRAAAGIIRENLQILGLEARATVASRAAAAALSGIEGEIVFLDPPYQETREYAAALAALGAIPRELVVVQHDRRLKLEAAYGNLEQVREVRQGDNVLSFYRFKIRQSAGSA
jgi:16S rRNA (guanine966-N2)-methyltransferase